MLSRGELGEYDDDSRVSVPGYEVFERAGSGGWWRGRRAADGANVALVCIPTQDWEPLAVQQAVDATAAFSRVRHHHLLGLHDVIPDVPSVSGQSHLVIATAVADGGSLSAAMAGRGALSFAEAVTALTPIGQALTAMHDVGHVHGWITPEVVFFTADGMPLLAPPWMDEGQGLVQSRLPHGNLAPEVVEGFPATPESDRYGYAALIWQTLSGESPGWVGTRGELEEVAPGVPPSLSRAVGRGLSPDPAERTSIEELLGCLHGLARPAPIEMAVTDIAGDVPRRIRAAARAPARAPVRRRKSGASHRQPRSHRRSVVAAIALVAILSGCAVLFMKLGDPPLPPIGGSPVAVDTAPPKTHEPDSEALQRTVRSHTVDEGRALAIVQRLLDARAGAWIGGSTEELAKAHATGSPALAADAGRLRAATWGGDRLQGVNFTARSGTVLPATSLAAPAVEFGASQETPSNDPVAFAMSLTVHRGAVTVIKARGQQSTVPASTDRVTVTVVQQAGAWRIYEWH